MKIKVMKFGGTSVGSAESRMHAALRVISAREQGFHVVAVVSAIGRDGAPYATDTLVSMLRQIDSTVQPDARELDLLMACGEILSSVVFAHTLKTLGHTAMAMRGGQAGIRTDGVYGNARILGVNPLGMHEALKRGHIPVVCGFQGVWVQGGLPGAELTTLGRGGSDTTATAVAAALGAESVEIYTDVDGVKTADPDFVPDAPTLSKVTYDEVAELAHLGARVLHPRAAEIAMRYRVPLWVKNINSEHEGTEIVPREKFPGRRVTGVSHTGKLVYLQFDLNGVETAHRTGFQSRVYQMLAQYGINLHMVDLSPSSVGFAVPREQYPTVEDLFDGLVMPIGDDGRAIYVVQRGDKLSRAATTQIELLGPIGEPVPVPFYVTEGTTMVSLVGQDYMQQPGVFYDVLSLLHESQIPVLQISDSDFSLSCLIPESELQRAVALLHDRFVTERSA
ncbi:MAG: aspartate kinase [Armatimonadetes bacterium]|nr:aspartate kinase [Armatimonadota bacterium]